MPKPQLEGFAILAGDELDRADMWANKDSNILSAELRERMVNVALKRAQVYALLAIAQEVKNAPHNMPTLLSTIE
jgi:hypothetical protein